MNIVYGLPRTGSHFYARHIANTTDQIFLGEVFRSPTPATLQIKEKLRHTLPKNSVIIVHPNLAYGNYSDEFYDWLFQHPLDCTTTSDTWQQMLSWGMAAQTAHYHSYNTISMPKECRYKRLWFDMLKNSFEKYYATYHRINLKNTWKLQDTHQIKIDTTAKYKLTTRTYNKTTDELFEYFTNKQEIKSWYQELIDVINV